MPTTLADLLKPALRIAGITVLPGTTPSTDQYTELIPAMNRMLSSWNLDGYKIFSLTITEFTLTANQKIYTIGTGGELNIARPLAIRVATMIYPGTPSVRQEVEILEDVKDWMTISVQDITGAPAWYLYYDHGNDANSRGKLYLHPQPPSGYKLELSTWTRIASAFAATTDAVTVPDGYEQAIVDNFALIVGGLYPKQSDLMSNPVALAEARDRARRSLGVIKSLNIRVPALQSEFASGPSTGNRDWLDGGYSG